MHATKTSSGRIRLRQCVQRRNPPLRLYLDRRPAQVLEYSKGRSASDRPVLPNEGTVEHRHHCAEGDANGNPGPQIRVLDFVHLTHREPSSERACESYVKLYVRFGQFPE